MPRAENLLDPLGDPRLGEQRSGHHIRELATREGVATPPSPLQKLLVGCDYLETAVHDQHRTGDILQNTGKQALGANRGTVLVRHA